MDRQAATDRWAPGASLIEAAVAVALCLLLTAFFAAPAWGVTVTIQPSNGDTMLDEIAPTTNTGTATTMQVRSQNSSRDRRIIVKFDLSQIPAGATITSANLELYMSTAPGTSRTHDAHRITQDWNETQATWNQRVTGTNWTTAGGTYNGTATGSTTTGTGSGVWLTWSISADVQAWVNGTQSNYGTLIKDRTENSGTAYTATFASEENGTAGNRPRLVVTYTREYSVTVAANSAVVMAEPSLLNFTVTNSAQSPTSQKISDVTLAFSYPVADSVSPAGWKQTTIGEISGIHYIRFDTVETNDPGCSSASLGAGQSAVFGVYVTAPAAAAESTTDTLQTLGLSAANDCNTPGTDAYTYTRTGALPTWTRRGLGSTMVATPVTLGVNGTITVTQTVTNRTTGTQNAVTPTTNPTVSGTGTVTKLSGPTPASANLAAGASQNFVYTYQATGAGSVAFTANASNANVQSPSRTSNTVEIGNLTAGLSVTPTEVTDGGQVTVTMSVTNNGATTLTTIQPSALTLGGTAGKTLVSGPTPTSVASLDPGNSTAFSWTYTVTGTAGQTYSFSGSASASGGVTSNSATSNTGTITSVSMSASPDSIPTTQGTTLTYTVNNDSGRAFYRVEITFPSGFTYSSASPPSGWTVTLNGSMVRFESGSVGTDLASGASGNFPITYSAVPGTAGTYGFSGNFVPRDNVLSSASATVSVNQYAIQISASPTTIAGDAASTSAITATLTSGGSPVSGATITFSKTIGTLSTTTATTNASGQASTTLTSAAVGTNQVATVTATYGAGTSANVNVTFEGVVLAVGASPTTVAADGQSTSTITATLTKAGVAWSGRTVTLSTTAGTLGTGSGTTNGSGQVSTTLTASVSESDVTATVTAGYLAPTFTTPTNVTFQRVVLTVSASPTTIAADGQATSTVTVTLTQGGAALSGATVTLSANAGSLSPTSVVTNASGQATATLTASASETDVTATVTATYKGHQKNTNVTFQRVVLTINASPTTIPADGVSTSAISITLTQGGSALSGASIGFNASAGSIAPGSTTTNGSGQATATLTSSSSGTDVSATVTATYKGVSKQVTVTFGALTLSLATAPASIPADGVTTSTLTATLISGGSGVSGRTVTFNTTSGTLSAASAVTNGSGQASVSIYGAASKSTSSASVTAAYGSINDAKSVTFTGITISEVAELSVAAGNAQSTAYWSWPTATGYRDGVVILRRAGTTPAVPADGLLVNAGDTLADGSRVVAKVTVGGGSSAADPGLSNGTNYFYRAVGYYAGSLYSAAGTGVDATPTAGGAGEPEWAMSSSNTATSELIWDGGGGLYWGSTAGVSSASDTAGTRLWSSVVTGGAVRTPPTMTVIDALPDLHIVLGTDTGHVYAVNTVTGGVLWQTGSALGDAIAAAPAVQYRADSDAAFQAVHSTDAIFVGTKNASATTNKIYALDALTGAVKWTFNAGGGQAVDQVTSYLWADCTQNRLWVVSKSNGGAQASVWVLNTVDGSVQASFNLGDVVSVGWSWSAGHLYVSTGAGNLDAIDTESMSLAWSTALALGSPVVGYVLEGYDSRGYLYLSTQNGQVKGAQLSAGSLAPTLIWTTSIAGATTPVVLGAEGVLYVGGADGKVHKIQLTDGADLAQVTAGDGTQAVRSIAVDSANGLVWATAAGGKLFALPLP